MTEKLINAIEASEPDIASEHFKEMLKKGGDPWEIHRSIFPVVQKVLNPPYINPHLPKMYAVNRELVPYLEKSDIQALVHLEIIEYAKRPKLKPLPKQKHRRSTVSFSDIESAISYQDLEMTTDYLSAFYTQKGGAELAHRMLLLGSGHLDDSLGHSVSCTAFIVLEMLQRTGRDPRPALATLADYFCKGRFHNIPASSTPSPDPSDASLRRQLLFFICSVRKNLNKKKSHKWSAKYPISKNSSK